MARFAFPAIVVLIFAGYFSLQICPTFYYWDSAELTAAVAAGGVPHPPGFPLLLILGRIFIAVTPFDHGMALNLLSALFAVIGLGLWFFVIKNVLQSCSEESASIAVDLFSFLGTVLLGITFSYGIQAVRFEVYSLSFALFAMIFLTAQGIPMSDGRIGGRLLLPAIVAGLALGTHILTIILSLPGIIMFLVLSPRIKVRQLLIVAFFTLVTAFIVYGYIYYLARRQPVLNWGDPSDLKRLFDYLTAREFTVSVIGSGLAHISANLAFVIKLVVRQFGLPAFLLSLWGLYHLARYNGKIGYPLILILALNIFSITLSKDFFYENYDLHGYLLISLAVTALSAAVGLQRLHGLLSRLLQGRGFPIPGKRAVYPSVLLAILIFAYPLRANMLAADLSDVRGAEDYAREFLSGAPDNAVIITSYYNTYFCLLAQCAQAGNSHDKTIFNLYNWDHRWGREDARQRTGKDLNVEVDRQAFYRNFINNLMKDLPVYVEYDESSTPLANYLLPDGLGCILTAPDTSAIYADKVPAEIETRLAELAGNEDLETVKTWVLWFQNRSLFYEKRGFLDVAAAYFAAAESLAVSRKP